MGKRQKLKNTEMVTNVNPRLCKRTARVIMSIVKPLGHEVFESVLERLVRERDARLSSLVPVPVQTSTLDVLEELETSPGGNTKLAVLRRECDNELLKRAVFAALDPYTVYYVGKFKVQAPTGEPFDDNDVLSAFIDVVLPALSSRSVTGNASKYAVGKVLTLMTAKQQRWAVRILLKNLRIGVQSATINKVWPGLVKSFAVSLANTLQSEFKRGSGIKLLRRVKYPVRVEPKLDGIRLIAVKTGGAVTFYTRNGTVLDTLPRIRAALESAPYDDFVLDGEGMSRGKDWATSASVMMSRTVQKDDSDIEYNVFDAVPLKDWTAQRCVMPYSERSRVAKEIVDRCVEGSPVKVVPHFTAQGEESLKRFFTQCMDDGYEGVMLKTLDSPYLFKRSDNILKLKPCVTYEGVIVGHYCGRAGTRRENLFGGFEVMLGNGIVTRLGGGFTDVLKATIQLEGASTYVGRIVELEAQPDPTTKDGLSADGCARFPVFVRFRDERDVDPSAVRAGKKFLLTRATDAVSSATAPGVVIQSAACQPTSAVSGST